MGDFMSFLCGYKNAKNKSTPYSFQTRFFGEKAVENEMAKPCKMVLDKFSDLIKKKQFENNNIIVASIDTDPEALDGDIKFDSTTFFINYDKPVKDYFKKIKIK